MKDNAEYLVWARVARFAPWPGLVSMSNVSTHMLCYLDSFLLAISYILYESGYTVSPMPRLNSRVDA